MCGIFGSYRFGDAAPGADVARAMAASIAHRGPDAGGVIQSERAMLGNQRLAILDLSAASNQPLFTDDGRLAVVQNGEIYNFVELREELRRQGARFTTSGDTEVILRAFEHWGPSFVTRLNGMFAIAVLDVEEERLLLYRDRLGVKPLYLAGGFDHGQLMFASEIKALTAAGWPVSPDLSAIAQYLALNYIPAPATAFSGITHLPPGSMAVVTRAGITIEAYWSLGDITPEPSMSEAEAKAGLLTLLDDATRLRMRSDAQFGAFLSGGLDSSSVVGFMSMYQSDPVRTYAIGFDDPRFDESHWAARAARRFGTAHRAQVMQPEAVDLWPQMIWHCDQPHGDVSFMPMLQVSALAAQDVKMVLTGDGGDELFGGYEKYLDIFPGGEVDALEEGWEHRYARQSGLLTNAALLIGQLREAFITADPHAVLAQAIRANPAQDPINRLLMAETQMLLPGNNLVKPDRMAMAHSLEVRSPFLDYRMAEFAFTMPGALKLRGGETKWIYKSAVEPLLGRELTWRRKQMFTVPVGEWFRQRLAGYCRAMLLDGRLEARGLFSASEVATLLADHVAGTANNTRILRALISLEIWFRLFVDRDPAVLAAAQRMPERIAA
jgi:asparagine synthase (glutamine-hydrolysing)